MLLDLCNNCILETDSALPLCFLTALFLYPMGEPTCLCLLLCFFLPPSFSLVRRISPVLKWYDQSHPGKRSRVTMVPAFLVKAMKCVNAAPVRGVSIIRSDVVFTKALFLQKYWRCLFVKKLLLLENKSLLFSFVLQERRGSLQTQRETAWMWGNKGRRGPEIPPERAISPSPQREGSPSYKAGHTRNTLRYL